MIDKVRKTLDDHLMLKKGMRVLLCVSGGADSVAMLLAFDSLRRDMHLKLFIAHLNHKLRGKDSDKDQEYVKRLAGRLRLPVITAQEEVRKQARSDGYCLEDAARRARYSFFLRTARDLNVDAIATAHTKDDQAETVLMRLLRGSGLRGLKGISPKRMFGDFALIRPLINISRKEIEAYLRRRKIKPRLDTSNLTTEFFRNKVRLKLLPLLEKEYSPMIKELLSNLSEVLDKDYEYLDHRQQSAFMDIAKIKKDNTVSFSLADFRREHLSTQRALVRRAIEFLRGSLNGIDYRHWKEIESLVKQRPLYSIVHLPGGYEAVKTSTAIIFRQSSGAEPVKADLEPIVLKIPGITRFAGKTIKADITEKPQVYSSKPYHPATGDGRRFFRDKRLKTEKYFDMEKVSLPLILRFRRPGDKMVPMGMRGQKKVADIFIDEKVPRGRRNSIPMIVSAKGEVLWLCGVKISDRCKILHRTKKVLKLKLQPR